MQPRKAAWRLAVTLVTSTTFALTQAIAQTTTKEFTPDNTAFANPERGFHNRYDLVPGGEKDFSRSTNAGNTLIHSYIRLDNYRQQDIPSHVLEQLSDTLAAARQQGKKVVLRTAYNFGPYPNSEPDASEYWINQHLGQLSPVFHVNQDVIAYIEAGFIGAWGEWHTSTNGLDTDPSAKLRIANVMLEHFPESLHIAMRYPSDARAISSGLGSSNRIGSHQDCFLASEPDDWGTWGRDPAYSIEDDKAFIGTLGLSHPVGGETCNVDSPRVNCATALAEMAQMRFSEINEDFDQGVIEVFKAQGCYDEIDRRLGYRFRLLNAQYSTEIPANGALQLSLTLTNEGFAPLYNNRPVFILLQSGQQQFQLPTTIDPRQWKPGDTITLNQSLPLPASISEGKYSLALWMPDRAETLRGDARYSVRFANAGTWNSATGSNLIAETINIGPATTEPTPTPTVTPTATPTATPTITPTPTPTLPPTEEQTFEAEHATRAGNAIVAECAACSNGQKVGYIGNGAGSLSFDGINVSSTGDYAVTIHYLSAVTRTANLNINATPTASVTFDGTGNWDTPNSKTVSLPLVRGNNTLTIDNASGWAPDIDRIIVHGNLPQPPSPTPTPSVAPTPTPEPPEGNSLVLDNFNRNGQLLSNDLGFWTGTSSFSNNSNVLQNGQLVLEYNNTGWFGSDIRESIENKEYLVLVIRGKNGGEQQDFHLSIGGVDKLLSEFTSQPIESYFTTLRINLDDHGINKQSPGQLQMSFWWGGSSTLFIDEIRFE